MNTIGSAATPTKVATNTINSAQNLANLSSLANNFTSSTSSTSGLNFNTLILSLLMQIIQTLLKNMQNKNCCCDQPSKPQTLNLSTDQLHQLNNGQIVNWNSADTKNLQIADKDGSGSVTAGDILSVPVRNNADKLSVFTHLLTEDESQVINGNYGKTLGQYTSPLLTTSDLAVNLPNPTNEALARALQLDTAQGDYLRVVFDKDGNGKLSQGDIAVIDYYGASPAIGNLSPRFATGPYIELTADIVQNILKPNENFSLSNQDKQRFVSIFVTGSDPANFIEMIDSDKSGTVSVGDQVRLEEDARQLDTNNQPILATISKTLTANNIKTYENLDAPNQLSVEDTKRAQQNIYPKGASTGGGSMPKLTGSYYDNDNNNQISLGDQLEALYYKDTTGAPSADRPYMSLSY